MIDRKLITTIMSVVAIPRYWHAMSPANWRELGRLMAGAVPDEDQERVRAEVRRRHPGWTDQIQAATDEAWRDFDAARIPGITRVVLAPDAEADHALRGQVLRIVTGLAGGSLTGCPHTDLDAPRPIFAASWGNRVDCRPCLALHEQPDPTPLEARTCDLCGRVGRDPVLLSTPQVGMITIGLGICPPCVIRLGGLPDP